MRYLYGDSTPFPLGYNFLRTLEAFMNAATRVVQLDLEGARIATQRDELSANRVKGLDALEQFHVVVMRAVQDTAQKVQHHHALDYARNVADFATRYIEEHRQATLASDERELSQLRLDGDRRTAEARAHLETFLKTARFPVLTTRLSIRLNFDGREARHTGTAAFEHPDGIATSFIVAPHRTAVWAAPRKVSDFVQGVDLRVGVEKSWLRGTVTAKVLNVDDWTIMQAELSDDAFDLLLRRKLSEREMLGLRIRRDEMGSLDGTVEHPGAPGAETLPGTLHPTDVAQIERIWVVLKAATRDVIEQKEQLVNVALDGQPVFENGLSVPLVVRLVAMFGPTVREITRRSPNEFELTLKTEAEGGRREELYLRKEALLSALQPLPAKGREVFVPLGLDKWVPSMTAAPPAVAVSASNAPPRMNLASSAPPGPLPAVPPIPSSPPSKSRL